MVTHAFGQPCFSVSPLVLKMLAVAMLPWMQIALCLR